MIRQILASIALCLSSPFDRSKPHRTRAPKPLELCLSSPFDRSKPSTLTGPTSIPLCLSSPFDRSKPFIRNGVWVNELCLSSPFDRSKPRHQWPAKCNRLCLSSPFDRSKPRILHSRHLQRLCLSSPFDRSKPPWPQYPTRPSFALVHLSIEANLQGFDSVTLPGFALVHLSIEANQGVKITVKAVGFALVHLSIEANQALKTIAVAPCFALVHLSIEANQEIVKHLVISFLFESKVSKPTKSKTEKVVFYERIGPELIRNDGSGPIFLPQRQLFRHLFRWFAWCCTLHTELTFPLGSYNKNSPDGTVWRKVLFQSSDVRLLTRKCHARSRIDRILDHQISLVQKKFSEQRCAFSCVSRHHWQVKVNS